jgi:hypothetical protein
MNSLLPAPAHRLARAIVFLAISSVVPSFTITRAAEAWTDITGPLLARITNSGAKLDWPGGCSGVVVSRTNGDVTVKVVGQGLWRSRDHGANWDRIDSGTISGRDETGWATAVDPESPGRMASFSLDGKAGWTRDGREWKRFADLGRNWDYGSVDWSSSDPLTIIGARHETTPPGEVYVSRDGGASWRLLDVHLSEHRGRVSMVGALGPDTVIHANGDGIHRSHDAGMTWTKVSEASPLTRVPVVFRGVAYLGTTNGLVVSADRGVTWRAQGAPVNVWQGPFFGRDATEMLVVGRNGLFVTRDAGTSWKHVADLKEKIAGFQFTADWFGCYAWDPVGGFVYASSMGNGVYRMKL